MTNKHNHSCSPLPTPAATALAAARSARLPAVPHLPHFTKNLIKKGKGEVLGSGLKMLPVSHIRLPGFDSWLQFLATADTERQPWCGSSQWAPVTHVGNLYWVSSSWHSPGPALALWTFGEWASRWEFSFCPSQIIINTLKTYKEEKRRQTQAAPFLTWTTLWKLLLPSGKS